MHAFNKLKLVRENGPAEPLTKLKFSWDAKPSVGVVHRKQYKVLDISWSKIAALCLFWNSCCVLLSSLCKRVFWLGHLAGQPVPVCVGAFWTLILCDLQLNSAWDNVDDLELEAKVLCVSPGCSCPRLISWFGLSAVFTVSGGERGCSSTIHLILQ